MIKYMLCLLAVLTAALGARPVLAQDGREYVGETMVQTDGFGPGILAFHVLCEADFPGARMCSFSDILRSGGAGAALPLGAAWVQPTLVGGGPAGSFVDASGVFTPNAGALSCGAWGSNDPTISGLALFSRTLRT